MPILPMSVRGKKDILSSVKFHAALNIPYAVNQLI